MSAFSPCGGSQLSRLGFRSRNVLDRAFAMPARINDTLLNASLYFYPDEASASEGRNIGGSGFLVGVPFEDGTDGYIMWAVTNKHVIDSGNWTIRLNRQNGGVFCIDTNELEWSFHPEGDDLAVRPLYIPRDAKTNFIPVSMMLTQSATKALDIGPGDEAFAVGRFISRDGLQRNSPTVRFGRIAQNADEEVAYDGYRQKAWLVEIMSLNGYSGAPVFCILDSNYYRDVEMTMKGDIDPFFADMPSRFNPAKKMNSLAPGVFPSGPFLLGVDCCMIRLWSPVCDVRRQEVPSQNQVSLNTGMMGVIPSWRLREMLLAHPKRGQVEALARAEFLGAGDAAAS